MFTATWVGILVHAFHWGTASFALPGVIAGVQNTDMLAIVAVFDGGHDGDWRQVVAGVLDCAPLLWSVKGKPKKREELLSHLIR